MALTDDDVNKVALAAGLNAARATLLAGKTYIAGYPQGAASELGTFDLTATVKQIAATVAVIAAKVDIDPAELAAIQQAAQAGSEAGAAAAIQAALPAFEQAVAAALPADLDAQARAAVLGALHQAAQTVADATT